MSTSMVAMEERMRFTFLLGICMFFIHACEACCGHSSIAFARRMNGRSLQFKKWFMRVWGKKRGAYRVKNGCTDL